MPIEMWVHVKFSICEALTLSQLQAQVELFFNVKPVFRSNNCNEVYKMINGGRLNCLADYLAAQHELREVE